jgi:hypothetical protein
MTAGRFPLAALLPAVLWAPACTGPVGAALERDVLFVRAEPAAVEVSEAWAARAEAVRVNERAFAADAFVPGDTLGFDVFEAGRLRAVVGAVDTIRGHRAVRARLLPPEEGDLLLTLGPERAAGSLHWRNRRATYYLRYDAAHGTHVLTEVDPSQEDVLPGAPPPPTPPPPR